MAAPLDPTTSAWALTIAQAIVSLEPGAIVLSPGSRSTPIAIACFAVAESLMSVCIDERTASFRALGMAKGSGRPVVLVSTSGSAPCHWLPAIVEADACNIPVLALSCDRPREDVTSGASQTIDQTHLFGRHVRAAIDLEPPTREALKFLPSQLGRLFSHLLGPPSGPIHMNVRFRKPLEIDTASAVGPPSPWFDGATRSISSVAHERIEKLLAASSRPAMVFGPRRFDEPRVSESVASSSAIALVGESTGSIPSSALTASLGDATSAPPPDLVFEFGLQPVSGAYAQWSAEATRIVVSQGDLRDPQGTARGLIRGRVDEFLETLSRRTPTSDHRAYRQALSGHRTRHDPESGSLTDPAVAMIVAQSIPAHAHILVGNSLIIRDFETFASSHLSGSLAVHHQRGAAGIDGLIATATGLRSAVPKGAPVLLILGDVSAAHDIGSLAAARGCEGSLTVIVVDNGGGRIFEQLPVFHSGVSEAALSKLFTTAPNLSYAAIAEAFGLYAQTTSTTEALRHALSRSLERSGPSVIHCLTDHAASTRLRAHKRVS